jgi:hypothetical protein
MKKPFGAGIISKIVSDRSIRRARRTVAPTRTAGVAGTPVYGGFVDDFERDRDLIGRNRYRTFSNMLANVSIVAAGTRFFLNLVSNPDWKARVKKEDDRPPDFDEEKAEELAKKTTRILNNMDTPWNRVVRRTAMFRFYGYSIQELTFKKMAEEEGMIGLKDIAPRPQITIEKWDVEEDGEVKGVIQRAPLTQREIYLPRNKIIYAVDDALSDSPEGLGLFRHCVEPTRVLQRYEQLEGWGFETDLRGTPIGRAPLQALQELVDNGDISPEDRDAKILGMTQFIDNHIRNPKLGLLLDSLAYESADEAQRPSNVKQWDLELLKSGGTSHAEVAVAIERKIREMARVLGVEHLLLGDNGVGSFAMAKDKSHNFALIVDSTLKDLVAIYMKDVVKRIFELNGWPMNLLPILVTDKLKFRNIDEITGALRDMAQAGVLLHEDDPAILEVRDLLGLSHPITVIDPEDLALMGGMNPPDESQGDEDSLAARLARSNDPNDTGKNDNDGSDGGAGGGGSQNKPRASGSSGS